jgi:hypothetical protein
MTKIAEKFLKAVSLIILLILVSILALPASLIAAGAKPKEVGKPQRIQNPQKLENAMHTLLQKAYAQQKIINGWHRKARLETARMEAKEREESAKALAAASRRACQIQLAMARTPEDITIPGCRFKSKTH